MAYIYPQFKRKKWYPLARKKVLQTAEDQNGTQYCLTIEHKIFINKKNKPSKAKRVLLCLFLSANMHVIYILFSLSFL